MTDDRAMIEPLTAAQVLDIWEIGAHQPSLERALTVLAIAFSETNTAAFAELTIGQRDRRLLDVREATFGTRMESRAACPDCGEALEFALLTHDVRVETPALPHGELVFAQGDWQVVFHPPTSRDLLALPERVAAANESPVAALLSLCVSAVACGDQLSEISALPNEVLSALIEYMAECDPQSDLTLNLVCPNCAHQWSVVFDIESYLWAELRVRARHLFNQVHTLARAYGWREADILSMSASRRAQYIEIVIGG